MYILGEIDTKVVVESEFSMDRGFKAQLFLRVPPLFINLTQSWCTDVGMAWTQVPISIRRKFVLTITPLEWMVATHIIFNKKKKQEEKRLKLSYYLNQIKGIIAILKAL